MARVLVVDDERSVRHTFALFLSADGHEVLTAEDAEEALALLTEVSIDIVVSDIILPRTSGIELTDHIAVGWPGIPVILVTGEPTVETSAYARQGGAFAYLVKPVSGYRLQEEVARAVSALRGEPPGTD